MRKEYDIVYLTDTPSFYKVKHFNEVAKSARVLMVFNHYSATAVNADVSSGKLNFDTVFLHRGASGNRNKFATFFRLMTLLHDVKWHWLLYAGWKDPEYLLCSLLMPRKRNAIVCESTIYESSVRGLRGLAKRLILARMNAALPSGEPHKQIFDSLGYKGRIIVTGGVGLMDKSGVKLNRIANSPLRYIYVGRLVDVKNVGLLIDVFNKNGKPLTIVGRGLLENQLKAKANSNITFTGFIDNDKLFEIYQQHDVFVLASKSEPWGLVVEEALYWGLPVIVSDVVGCSVDLVKNYGSGCTFRSRDAQSLDEAVEEMELNYESYRAAVDKIDWEARHSQQVAAFLSLLN